jgi:hypothetical protein
VRIRPVNDGGLILFRFYYRFEGKQKWLTLKASELPEARAERDLFSRMLKDGIDPNLGIKLLKEYIRQQQLDEQEALNKT